MSTPIKEALVAVHHLEGYEVNTERQGYFATTAIIRAALEAAQQESDDRAAVEAWLDADDDRLQSNGRQYRCGYYLTLYPNQMRDERHPFYGATRSEALKMAAIWCRSQVTK